MRGFPDMAFMSGVFRPRGGGKTKKLVDIADENPLACIVVNNRAAKDRLIDRYPNLEEQILTIEELKDGRKMRGRTPPAVLMFDDFEHAIRHFLPQWAAQASAYVVAATGSQL